jgi:uncharacterized membrane protein YbhN (UPF0104 family)
VDAAVRRVSRGLARGRREGGGLSGDGPPGGAPAAGPAGTDGGAVVEHLGRRLLPAFGLGLLVLAGMLGAASPARFLGELRRFDFRLLVPILALSLLNYGLRFLRWEVYLERLGSRLPRGRSLAVFVVGFLLSVTPGKAGELGKAWLVRELGGGPALRVAPAVLAERATDLLGVLILLALGALPFAGGIWWAAGGFAACALALALLTWEGAAIWTLARLGRLPVLGPRVPALAGVYRGLRELLSPRLLVLGVLVAVAAWGAEGAGFVLAVRAFAPGAGFLVGIFDYTAGTFLGSATMLPGGLGAADGALAALLRTQGLDTARATLVTFISRGATLWFAVLLGLLALPWVAHWLTRRGRAARPGAFDPARLPSREPA